MGLPTRRRVAADDLAGRIDLDDVRNGRAGRGIEIHHAARGRPEEGVGGRIPPDLAHADDLPGTVDVDRLAVRAAQRAQIGDGSAGAPAHRVPPEGGGRTVSDDHSGVVEREGPGMILLRVRRQPRQDGKGSRGVADCHEAPVRIVRSELPAPRDDAGRVDVGPEAVVTAVGQPDERAAGAPSERLVSRSDGVRQPDDASGDLAGRVETDREAARLWFAGGRGRKDRRPCATGQRQVGRGGRETSGLRVGERVPEARDEEDEGERGRTARE